MKLIGDVLNVSTESTGWRKVTVIDLSMVGLRFEVVGHNDIEMGHILRVRFTLDNQKATEIEKEVGVVNNRQDQFGCEFLIIDDEKELGGGGGRKIELDQTEIWANGIAQQNFSSIR